VLAAGLAAVGIRVDTIRFGLAPDTSEALAAGVRFGLAEAARAASLLGHRLEMATDAPIIIDADASIVTGGVTFALKAGAAAYDEALATARVEAAVPANAEHAKVVEWHHALHRYGASELNDRFFKAAGARMRAEHWLGWLAVKVITEASMRTAPGGGLPAAIARGRFDGHKGVALTFAADTRRLLQPLYVIDTSNDMLVWPR
jgi:hypothetical protein